MSSTSELVLIAKIVSICSYSILLAAGIIGSCANLYVFSRKRLRRNPCSSYILAASLFDFLNIIFSVTTRLMADGFTYDPFALNSIACRIRTYLAFIFSFCPMGYRCLAILDRYFYTSRSVYLRNFSRIKLTNRISLINCIFWIFLGIPMLIVFNSIQTGPTTYVCNTLNAEFTNYFSFFVNPVLYFFIPVIVLTCFSFLTYRNIRTVGRILDSKVRQLTFMIIVETCLFAISSIPHGTRFMYIFLTSSVEKNAYRKAQENLFYQISRITFFFNSAFAFYIYFSISTDVRSIIKRIFIQNNNQIMPHNRIYQTPNN